MLYWTRTATSNTSSGLEFRECSCPKPHTATRHAEDKGSINRRLSGPPIQGLWVIYHCSRSRGLQDTLEKCKARVSSLLHWSGWEQVGERLWKTREAVISERYPCSLSVSLLKDCSTECDLLLLFAVDWKRPLHSFTERYSKTQTRDILSVGRSK